MFINLRSLYKESMGVWDVESSDLIECGHKPFPCHYMRVVSEHIPIEPASVFHPEGLQNLKRQKMR